jgi:hypothetical protein
MGLIAGEIDIEVPDIEFDQILKFIKDTEILHRESKVSMEEKLYTERNKRQYPWNRRLLELNGVPFFNYRNISPFNQLCNLIDSLPINPETRTVLLLNQKIQLDYDFNFHFDGDDQYGFRICLGLDINKSFLEMAKLRSEFIDLNSRSNKIEEYMVELPTHQIIPSKSNTVFCINGSVYPHRVPINNSCTRSVIIVRGKLTNIDNLKFLQKVEE